MEDIFKPYRDFLESIAKIIERKVARGECDGMVTKWRREGGK